MKRLIISLLLIAVVFGASAAVFDILCIKAEDEKLSSRNVAVNRINDELGKILGESGASPDEVISAHMDGWRRDYGSSAPDEIRFISLDGGGTFRASIDTPEAVCSLYSSGNELMGFAEYRYDDNGIGTDLIVVNTAFAAAFLLIAAIIIYIWLKILRPFKSLTDYPERLARLRDIQKLPESRSRYFGKYIWGMNMLSDVLTAGNKRIHALEGEHQKLVTTIAHGVKTPVANIRLYTDAARTGLYSGQGMTERIADSIDRNAAKIEKMAAELMEASAASCGGYEIELSRFGIDELAELVRSEYKDRMTLKRIPFTVECNTGAVIESDKYALYRAVSQMLENAVKYGDGGGIKVTFMMQDSCFSISVRNRGELLPENELPYVFRSYWRGSNAAAEGSGIGLYAVHETVRALGGSVHARRLEESSEMEFVISIDQ